MKRPPSQRPERQGPMHTYIVGQPYEPSRRSWDESEVIRCQFEVIRCRFVFSGKNDELTPDFFN